MCPLDMDLSYLDIPVVGQMQVRMVPFRLCYLHHLFKEGYSCEKTGELLAVHMRGVA